MMETTTDSEKRPTTPPPGFTIEDLHQSEPYGVEARYFCFYCSRFLFNPHKTECCNNNICGQCAETKFDDVKLCPICQHDPFSKACVCLAGIATRVSGLARMKLFKAKLNGQSPSSPSEANSPAASGTNEQPNAGEVKDEVASEQPGLEISRNGSTNTKDLEQSNLPSPPDSAQAATAQDWPISSNDGGPPPLPRTRSNNRQRKTEPAALGTQSNNAQPMTQNTTRHPQNQTNAAVSGGQHESAPFANSTSNGQPMVNPMLFMQMMQMTQMYGGFMGNGTGMNAMNGQMNQIPNMMGQGTGWNGGNPQMFNQLLNSNMNGSMNGFGHNQGFNTQAGNFQYGRNNPGQGNQGSGRGRGRGRGGNFNGGRNRNNNLQQGMQNGFPNFMPQQPSGYQYGQQTPFPAYGEPMIPPTLGTQVSYGQGSADMDSDDEFAPGGLDDIKEALGDAYWDVPGSNPNKPKIPKEPAPPLTKASAVQSAKSETQASMVDEVIPSTFEDNPTAGKYTASSTSHQNVTSKEGEIPVKTEVTKNEEDISVQAEELIEAGKASSVIAEMPPSNTPLAATDSKVSMPPPLAPTGPAKRSDAPENGVAYPRSPGNPVLRTQPPLTAPLVSSMSPIRPVARSPIASSPDARGTGVIGAPTGPRAMRDPPSKHSRDLSNGGSVGGGFRIIGRASEQGLDGSLRDRERSRSPSQSKVHTQVRHRSKSRERDDIQLTRHSSLKRKLNDDDMQERSSESNRSHKKVKPDASEHERDEKRQHRVRSASPDRRQSTSYRDRKDTETPSRHRSSRSSRHHEAINGDKGHEVNASMDLSESRDGHHRSSKSRKHGEREGERRHEREKEREVKPVEEARKTGYQEREDQHRDRHRKRSRDEYETPEDEARDESGHRVRRHKREHRTDREELKINGASKAPTSEHTPLHSRPSNVPTSRLQATKLETAKSAPKAKEPEKDPHTLEREARNRERMLKEQQRREKAMHTGVEAGPVSATRRSANGVVGQSRRMNYRYEDDLRVVAGGDEDTRENRRRR